MAKITLIRHGQASFGAVNYDLLSEVGRLQAAAVGEYFKACRIGFDQIIHGEMSRQSETAQIIAHSMGFNHSLIQNSALNEFDSDSLIKYYLPKALESFVALGEEINGDDWLLSEEKFTLVYHALITMWQSDKNCPFESWREFQIRVKSFFDEIASKSDSNEKIVIVTSGGLISVVLQEIWQLEERTFAELTLSINNASLSEIKINANDTGGFENRKNQLRLLSFNNISPLQLKNDKQYITRK